MRQLIRLRTLGMGLLALIMVTPSVFAHGERALEPFIRMRTIQWYDIAWSHTNLKVNDEVILSGRFHVAEDWPNAVAKPDSAFLNLAMPTPVLLRTGTYMNGVSVANSVDLHLGADYEFKLSLKARIPGRYHIHPMMNLRDVGVIVGPGMWIEVAGVAADFRNETTTASGRTIDLETFGTRNGVAWQARAWRGLAFVVGATPTPSQARASGERGGSDHANRSQDRDHRIGRHASAHRRGLRGCRQSLSRDHSPANGSHARRALAGSQRVGVEVKHATYRVVERSLSLTLEVTNQAAQPIQLAELNTATIRFFNPEAGPVDLAYPEELSARTGLRVESNAPIAPGEIRTVHVTATDAAWDLQKLSTIIKDADSRVGALLFFYDTSGARYLSSISASAVPVMGGG